MKNEPNELNLEFLGIHAINPFIGNDSSPRSSMFSNHFAQHLSLLTPEAKRIQTGFENELGKMAANVKIPEDCKILRIIDRYDTRGNFNIDYAPERLVIYEEYKTNRIGCLSLRTFNTFHTKFGFKLIPTEEMYNLAVGAFMKKGTVLAKPVSVDSDDNYAFGVNANVVFMSHPAVSEDGVLVSESFLKRLKFEIYEKRVVSFGRKKYPINLYGDSATYKPFPDIGEQLRPDGLLAALRDKDENFYPADISVEACKDIDFIFDGRVYSSLPGGVVVDVKVFKAPSNKTHIATGIMDYYDKYHRAFVHYARQMKDLEAEVRREKKKLTGNDPTFTPELHRLLVEAEAVSSGDYKVVLTNRNEPLDTYRVEFTIKHEVTPSFGFKMTDQHGGKGVACSVLPEHMMPVDMDGNIAEIVVDQSSTISRMNIGRVYEAYLGGAARDVTTRMRQAFGVTGKERLSQIKDAIASQEKQAVLQVFIELLTNFFGAVTDAQKNAFIALNHEDKIAYIAEACVSGLKLYYPPNNQKEVTDVISEVDEIVKPVLGKLKMTSSSGEQFYTKEDIQVGEFYVLLLDKIADDFKAVASSRLNHFGFSTKMTAAEKYTHPNSLSSTKSLGETEARLLVSYGGRELIAELMDMSNNPITHKMCVYNLLTADKPTNIKRIVDREKQPLGQSKGLQIMQSVTMCDGWKPVYVKEGE